jgi:diguanylate cyclase (GGDEF)-like protein
MHHEALDGGDIEPVELSCRRHDGAEVWASISCSLFTQPDDAGPNLILQIQDITARRRAESELQHRAFHDKLTGLPNRERFHEALEVAIARADGGPGRSFAVLFLDFDRFKLINDSKGHIVGDDFLVQASRRLGRCLRKGDMLARLGGDEFAILAMGLTTDHDAVDLAERLLDILREPLRLSSMEIAATASIGITFSSMGYLRSEDMLRDADIAMYRAKVDGKARFALFDVRLHTEVTHRVRLEADLRQAMDTGQGMGIAFQPLYELRTGQLVGFEALSRWHHPELGPVSPATFIPIAEETGLITALTARVVEQACRQLRAWQSDHPLFANLSVHVNVAAKDVADPDFVGRIKRTLIATGMQSRHLVVELTENILMAQLSAAMGTLTELRVLGVGLSVDDFGTGYSSLSHLAVLPIDSLKIDMSFVRHLREGSKEEAVIRAIVLLGTSLGKEVIAEGIETQAQMELLRDLGCGVGQGYHLARPMPAEDIHKLLLGHARDSDLMASMPGLLPQPRLFH